MKVKVRMDVTDPKVIDMLDLLSSRYRFAVGYDHVIFLTAGQEIIPFVNKLCVQLDLFRVKWGIINEVKSTVPVDKFAVFWDGEGKYLYRREDFVYAEGRYCPYCGIINCTDCKPK